MSNERLRVSNIIKISVNPRVRTTVRDTEAWISAASVTEHEIWQIDLTFESADDKVIITMPRPLAEELALKLHQVGVN